MQPGKHYFQIDPQLPVLERLLRIIRLPSRGCRCPPYRPAARYLYPAVIGIAGLVFGKRSKELLRIHTRGFEQISYPSPFPLGNAGIMSITRPSKILSSRSWIYGAH